MLLLCYPKCTTCQKAKKWLDENGIKCDERDIKSENPSAEELRAWHKLSGREPERGGAARVAQALGAAAQKILQHQRQRI